MGQKVHPFGFRNGTGKPFSPNAVWLEKTKKGFSKNLLSDIKVREFLHKEIGKVAQLSRIEIARPRGIVITLFLARAGAAIGPKGEKIEVLRRKCSEIMGGPVQITIKEIKRPELDSLLVAKSIAEQLEKRVQFRRAMKRAASNAIRLGAKGIKICTAGRLGGAEIARTEWVREGRVPLHTLRADIDYAHHEALTTYGIIGIKVWIFKGEVIEQTKAPAATTE